MITEYIINTVTGIISTLGYPGIASLTALESIMVPIPPEVTLVFSGFLSAGGELNLYVAIGSAVFGALLGSSAAYFVGFHFKKHIIHKLMQKHGKFLIINQDEYLKIQNHLKTHGPWIITVARFIPGIRSVISILMGLMHVSYPQFLKFTFLGSLLSTSVLMLVGYQLGDKWHNVSSLIGKFDKFVLSAFVLLLLIYLFKKVRPATQE